MTPVRLSSLWSQMTGFASAFLHVIVLSVVLQIAAFAAPFQIQLVIDEAVFHADQDLLTVLALAFGALVVIQALVEALRGWTLRVFGHLLSFQIVGNLIRHMLRLPAEFFEVRLGLELFTGDGGRASNRRDARAARRDRRGGG